MDKHEQYVRVFKQLDEDGDGKVSPRELQQCVESLGGHVSLEETETAVTLIDSDGDGLLSLEDLVSLMEGGVGYEQKLAELKEVFKMFQEEEAGCINAKSLKRMLSRLGESKSLDQCKKMIAHFDLNHDGVLSFDEFKAMMSCYS